MKYNHYIICMSILLYSYPTSHRTIGLYELLQCEAPKIAKLVYNSNNYGLWYL